MRRFACLCLMLVATAAIAGCSTACGAYRAACEARCADNHDPGPDRLVCQDACRSGESC